MKEFLLNIIYSILALIWVVYDFSKSKYSNYQSNRTMSKLKDLGE